MFFFSSFFSQTQSIYDVTVPTPETVSINYWLNMLVDRKAPVMLVGIAGCGKTQLLKGLLGRQDEEKRISCTINMNFFTTTNLLQSNMEAGTFQSILKVCVCIIILVIYRY